ncbi:KxDL motif-containing protein [Acrasis kona]|uniref:KxDL motif-containing protein n=1 Tax=Acrasis kona TaxID=1008807 RepID=A0AAW2ZGT7_9EUKA
MVDIQKDVVDSELFSSEVCPIENIQNEEDFKGLHQLQEQILQTLLETNQALLVANESSEKRHLTMSKEFLQHASMLSEMKSDLEFVTKKIR